VSNEKKRHEQRNFIIAALSVFFYSVFICFLLGRILEANYFLSATDNKLRTFFEILSFISTALIVPGVAFWAASFAKQQFLEARRQADEAVHARLATVYMEINKKFVEQDVAESRRRLAALRRKYPEDKLCKETLSAYINRVLISYFNVIDTSGQATDYSKTMQIMTYFEDIAVLIHKKLIPKEIIFDFMGDTLVHVEECLKDHIIWRRKLENSVQLYANTLLLMKQAKDCKSNLEFNEGDYAM
jgi:hypothetical protein